MNRNIRVVFNPVRTDAMPVPQVFSLRLNEDQDSIFFFFSLIVFSELVAFVSRGVDV
jgi:hypothetical protein